MKKRKIVCGTDFSLHAAEAADVAAAIGVRLQETVVLIHAVEESGLRAASPNVRETVLTSPRVALERQAERLRAYGATVETELVTGPAHEVLLAAAQRKSTRVMVVSSLGHATINRLLIGSVAERVAESSPVPTLVVREGPIFVRWIEGNRPLKVLVGCDFSASSDAALHWLSTLREIGACEITAGYIPWPPEESSRLGLHAGAWSHVMPDDVRAMLERDLGERSKRFGNDIQIRVEPCWGRADLKLIDLASAENFDLIVVGTHQHRGVSRIWLGSVSRGVLHHARMSVLVVPKAAKPNPDVPVIPVVKRVLVPIDFSDLSNSALFRAYGILNTGGVVKLVHVLDPWELPESAVRRSKPKPKTVRQHKRLVSEAANKLGRLIPPEAENRGILSEVAVIESTDTARAICTEAERFGADLICLASHGRSGVSKMLLGSVARK